MPRARPSMFRQRAVELARQREKPIAKIAEELGISESCLRGWMDVADVDDGRKLGLTTDERAELLKLRRESGCSSWRWRSSSARTESGVDRIIASSKNWRSSTSVSTAAIPIALNCSSSWTRGVSRDCLSRLRWGKRSRTCNVVAWLGHRTGSVGCRDTEIIRSKRRQLSAGAPVRRGNPLAILSSTARCTQLSVIPSRPTLHQPHGTVRCGRSDEEDE